jgi:hypothetical protein
MKLYRTRLFKFTIIFLLFFSSGYTSIQYTNISQRRLTIGDKIELSVALVVSKGVQIIPPETEDGFGKFIVKNWSSDKIERNTSDSITYKYLLSIYEVEQCSIPALPFIVHTGDKTDTLFSDLIPMQMGSVIDADSGDTIRFKDLKAQQIAGSPSLLWLWITISLLTLAGLIFLFRYLWIKSRKPPPPPPPIPPYDEAVEALAALRRKELIEKGLLREYVFELSDILKRYMGRQFDSNAAEYTTEEMVDYIKTAPFESELKKTMEWFFSTTHPVKFAKMVPETKTVKQLYDETVLFIHKTRPSLENEKKQPLKEGEGK